MQAKKTTDTRGIVNSGFGGNRWADIKIYNDVRVSEVEEFSSFLEKLLQEYRPSIVASRKLFIVG